MADSSRHALTYVAESVYGTTPASATFKKVRHTGCSLALTKNTFVSEEIRADRQIADFRHGIKQVGGDINTELSYLSFDDFLEAVLCGTWSTPASPLTGTTISAAASDNSINDSGAGFPLVAVGDMIKIAGFATAGNNGRATVVSRTASKIVVSGLTLVNEAASASVTVTPAAILKAGLVRRSFSMLRDFSDITSGRFNLLKGIEFNKLSLKVTPGAIVTADFGIVGRDAGIADTEPGFVAGTAQVETAVVVGTIDGDGNATVTVTAAGLTGSPLAVSVAVLIGDDASAIAGKIRVALAANAAITALFSVGGAGANVVLTRLAAAANDATLNIAVDNGTCTGITPDATSNETTAGVADSTTSTFAAGTTTSPMDSFSGAVRLSGSVSSVITEISASLENGIAPRPIVGSDLTIRPSIGRSNLTGQLGLYFEDGSLVSAFYGETILSPEFTLGDGAAGNAYVFAFPKIKLTNAQPDVKGQGPVMITAPYQAIYDSVSESQIRVSKFPA